MFAWTVFDVCELIQGRTYSLREIKPADIPLDATRVIFISLNVTVIPAFSFSHLLICEGLYFENMPIDTIEDNAFEGLGNLRTLKLSRTKLSRIGRNTFNGLVSLHDLFIISSKLLEVEAFSFARLSVLHYLKLNSPKHVNRTIFAQAFPPWQP